jgi:acyl phosphate:glycerol-3-phosphate acyltransferase
MADSKIHWVPFMDQFLAPLAILLSYFLGSVSCAILICKILRKPDPRLQGSKNPCATNVLRIAGRVPALFVLLGDALKSYIPVLLALHFSGDPKLVCAVFIAAVFGHLFPIFFGFQGGKGVATYIGGIFAISPLLGGIFIATWCGVFALCRISSVSAIVAIVSMPIWAWFGLDIAYAITLGILGAIIIWRHRQNITRLIEGKETKSRLGRS